MPSTITNKQLRDIARKLTAKHPDLKGVNREHIRTVVDLIDEQRRVNDLGKPMVDIYELRGYGPRYTIDTKLKFPSLGCTPPYKKIKIDQSKIKPVYPTRIVSPRRSTFRCEAYYCKAGDIVYAAERNRMTRRISIIPYVVTEVDDCFLWARKTLVDKRRGYSTYLWIRPLVKTNGQWTYLPRKDLGCGVRRVIYNGCGHGVSLNDYGYDSVYLTPEEALGAFMATNGVARKTKGF